MKYTLLLVGLVAGLFARTASALPVRESLAMIETGAKEARRCAADLVRGSSGEVSRFQILPSVWRQYSKSRDYENPEAAWVVAQNVLATRAQAFHEKTGRDPSAMELYLLWHKPTLFKAAGFSPTRMKKIYQQRAERFANLVAS